LKSFAFLLVSIAVCAFAETDSVAFNLNTPSPLTLIQNGRHQIYQLLEKKEIDNARKLFIQMHKQIDTTMYNVFTPYERVSLDVLFGDFYFVSNLNMIDTIDKYSYNKAPVPNDGLMSNMRMLLDKNKMIVAEKIDKLEDNKIDFCRLYFHWLIADTRETPVQDSLNNEADKYLLKNPEGEHENFVRLRIRRVFTQSKWGLGLSFFSGYGHVMAGLENVYTNPILLGHSFDFFYNKFGVVLYNQFEVASKLKDSIVVSNDIWPEGATLTQFSPAIHVGYLFVTKRVFLFPYIGIAGHYAGIASVDTSKYSSDAETPYNASPVIGLTLDWKFAPTNGILVKPQESGSWVIRTDFSIMNTRHDKYDERFSGYMFMLKIGIGGIGWPIVREGLPNDKKSKRF